MSRLFALVTVVALLAIGSLTVHANDWPQFRGPKRDDVSTEKGLLKTWPTEGPKLVWKASGVGEDSFSAAAVVGDKVFTMGDKGESSFVFALDRANGNLLWSAKLGKSRGQTGGYPGTRGTPTVEGNRLYAIGQFGDLVCLDTADGKEKWRKSFTEDFGAKLPRWAFAESPLIDGDKLVCTPGGKDATIVALNKMTGEVIWKSALDTGAGYSSIVISEACKVHQYVQLTASGVFGVSAKDGKKLWASRRFAGNTANIPTPVVLGDQVFVSAGYGRGSVLFNLKPNASGGIDVEEVYHSGALTNKHGGVLIVGDYVFGDPSDSGTVYCALWRTGKAQWKGEYKTKVVGRRGSASLTYADGHLYIHYANGWVALADASPNGYLERGAFKIPNATKSTNRSWAHPVVADGKLYVREKDTLWCYDVKAR